MCNDSFSKILAFIGALVLGAVVALLSFFGILPALAVMVYIGLALSAAVLVFLLLVLLLGEHGIRCICRYAGAMMYAAVLSLAAAALLLAVLPVGFPVLIAVLAGVWATFAAFTLILFLMLVACFIAARCGCGSQKESCCSNGSCRFG